MLQICHMKYNVNKNKVWKEMMELTYLDVGCLEIYHHIISRFIIRCKIGRKNLDFNMNVENVGKK